MTPFRLILSDVFVNGTFGSTASVSQNHLRVGCSKSSDWVGVDPGTPPHKRSTNYYPGVERFVEASEASLWVALEGEGVPVLLVSGGPGCCDYLEPVARLLTGHAQTVRFDARGCGRSSPVSEYTLEASLADLERIRGFMGVDRWIVAGHSAGADLALAYAIEFPERLHGVVAISGGRLVDDRSWHAAYAAARDAGLEREIDYTYAPNMDANRALNAAWKAYCRRPGLWRDIAQIQVPALFIYGAKDIRPSWPIQQVAALIPNAELFMLETAGHNLWLTHAEELGEALRGFVSKFSDPVFPRGS